MRIEPEMLSGPYEGGGRVDGRSRSGLSGAKEREKRTRASSISSSTICTTFESVKGVRAVEEEDTEDMELGEGNIFLIDVVVLLRKGLISGRMLSDEAEAGGERVCGSGGGRDGRIREGKPNDDGIK